MKGVERIALPRIGVVLFAWLGMATSSGYAQSDSTRSFSDVVTLRGYVKNMQIFSFADNLDDITSDNLIHNRLNFRIYPISSVTVGLELRNRVFTGESVETTEPSYGELVNQDPGFWDLGWLVVDEPALVFLVQLDRAWIDWSKNDWEVRVGRQRINWGTNLFWNSNDLFNAYSLVDFDYEEMPGADAVRVQRHFSGMRTFDVALQPGRNENDWIGAMRYQFHWGSYDVQVLGSWWNADVAVGAGWAGNLGMAGLKGEVTYFHPRENRPDTTGVLSASLSSDYVFSNQVFLTVGYLLNSDGLDAPLATAENLFLEPLSAKSLMPTRHSALVSVSYPFTPIFSGGLTSIYSPGVNTAFLMPSLEYGITNRWEIALFGQSFWMQLNEDFRNIGNGVFVRLKWSF